MGDMPAVEPLDDGVFRRCQVCRLEFVDPTPPGVPTFPDFSAYGRDLLAEVVGAGRAITALLPTERLVLDALRHSLPRGAAVLELCAESGRFIAAVRESGFRAFATDPLEAHVQVIRTHGIPAAVGLLREVPEAWGMPDAVVMLESLVRFPNPRALLEEVRRLFPAAALHLVVSSPRRSLKLPENLNRLAYPPDHLTRWSRRSLCEIIDRCGYSARARSLKAGINFPSRRGLHGNLLALLLRFTGEGEVALHGVGEPRS